MSRKKNSKVSNEKRKRKNAKKCLRRKYLSVDRKCNLNDDRKLRRSKTDDYLLQCEFEEEGGSLSPGIVGHRMSDRKYVEKNVKNFQDELKNSSCNGDVVKFFGKKLDSIKWQKCLICHTRCVGIVKKCWCSKLYVMKSRLLLIGKCPEVLSGLSLMEQLLIARVHPVVQVYRLVGGQTGYSGHVINFFQDVKDVARNLPHTVADLKGIVKVSYDKLLYHKDFKIRKRNVLDALMYLKENNRYYSDVVIDQCALDSLPEDDSFHGHDSEFEAVHKGVVTEENIVSVAVPSTALYDAKDKLKHKMNWPTIKTDAISEMTCPYISQAFPSLYPTGCGDLFEVRDKQLTARIYFQYLMDYEDGRFAEHKIFPYFALNTVMRWECLSKGTVYIKDHPLMKKMNMEVLKDIMKENPDFMKDMLVYGSNIRGTREFWSSRSGELDAMCDMFSLPTVFFTSSAADMRWPRLKELILEHKGLLSVSEKDYYQYVIDHPKICSDYFYEMFTMFFESIVLGQFEVVDYWYRFEWQMRGSPHVHGVMWLSNACDVSMLESKFDEVKINVIRYYEKLISCESPNLNYVDVGVHPCSVKICDISSTEDDLSALINSVQMHACSKKCTNDGKKKCKYGFPKQLREESDVVLNDRKYYEFVAKRNHPDINQHNKLWLRALRSNGDWAAVLSDKGFRQYISKYVSKSEVKSRPLLEILSSLLCNMKDNQTVKSTVQKTFMAALVERDYSAQEVHHLLCGKKLFSCSRSFVKLNLKNSQWKYHMNFDHEDVKDNYNHVFHSYSKRPEKLRNVSLLKFVQLFNIDTYSARKRKAVPVIYPRLRLTGEDVDIKEIARQLVLLHVPWSNVDEICTNENGWVDIMYANDLTVDNLPYKKCSEIMNEETYDSDDESFGESEESNVKNQDDWMLFIGASLGESNSRCFESSELSHLVFEKSLCSIEEAEHLNSFLDDAKKNGIDHVMRHRDANLVLSSDQQEIINIVSSQISCLKDGSGIENFPQIILCQGAAGCGKTAIIGELEYMVVDAFGLGSVLIVAFTGSSAVNANGRTIHSAFRLMYDNMTKDVLDLKGESLSVFQEKMANVKFLVIEEFSMVGCRMLNIINRRCMQMKSCNKPFGGLCVYMFGDMCQIPPIGDTPLYNLNVDPNKTVANAGSVLFKSLVRTKFLDVHHRQVDVEFINFLDNLSRGVVNESGETYISDRFEGNMSSEEIESFSDAVHLYQYVIQVSSFNKRKLLELGRFIVSIEAENNNSYAKCSSDDLAGNLQNVLEIAIGARVMLRSNLWTEGGLVNGCIGTVEDIIYCNEIRSDAPVFILVKFENYYGPTLGNGCVPIMRVIKSWTVNNKYCTRYQFPLTLAYAMTIHKSQGLTLFRVVLHFDDGERSPGLFYVAMSRVREKCHLMIAGCSFNSFLFRLNPNNYKMKIDGMKWLAGRGI